MKTFSKYVEVKVGCIYKINPRHENEKGAIIKITDVEYSGNHLTPYYYFEVLRGDDIPGRIFAATSITHSCLELFIDMDKEMDKL